jgi:hypothetical protein
MRPLVRQPDGTYKREAWIPRWPPEPTTFGGIEVEEVPGSPSDAFRVFVPVARDRRLVAVNETTEPATTIVTQEIDAPASASATETRHASEVTEPDASERTETATLRPPVPAQPQESAPSDGVDRDGMTDLLAAESPPPPQPPPFTLPAPPPEVTKRRRTRSASPDPVIEMERPFWDPRSGRFNGPLLRQAIVNRQWTIPECARVCGICPATLYNACNSHGMSDRTAGKIFEGLGRRQPPPPIPELMNAR